MIIKKYACACGVCRNSFGLEYFGTNLINFPKTQLREMDKLTFKTLYVDFTTYSKNRQEDGKINASVRIDVSKIPDLIKDLQEIYQESQQVQEELKKQGKLEQLSQNNKPNLSEQEIKYMDNLKKSILPGQVSPL